MQFSGFKKLHAGMPKVIPEIPKDIVALRLKQYDDSWLYGGSQTRIAESIARGRNGIMPAQGEFLGEAKIHLLTAYVYSLSQPR